MFDPTATMALVTSGRGQKQHWRTLIFVNPGNFGIVSVISRYTDANAVVAAVVWLWDLPARMKR